MRKSIEVAVVGLIGILPTGCGRHGLSAASGKVPDAGPPDSAPDTRAAPDGGPDAGPPDSAPGSQGTPDGGNDDGAWDPGPDGPSAPDARSDGSGSLAPVQYAMTATLTPVDGGYAPPAPTPPPPNHSFSVLVDWSGNAATSGANGGAQRVALQQIGDSEWESTEPLNLNLGSSTYPSVTYSTLKLTRGQDGCTATASGTYEQLMGDVIYSTSIKATMTGAPDKAGPQFSVVPAGNVHPLSLDGIMVNELLPGGTTATLDIAGASLPLTPSPSDTTLGTSAFLLPDKALAFGATYTLHVQPEAMDLAGNKTATLPSFATLPDPGLFAQDGFEGPIQAVISGFAAIADNTVWPIPDGAKALAAQPVGTSPVCSARFTARLAVPAAATSVKLAFLTYTLKSGLYSPYYTYDFTVAAPNGAAVSTFDFQLATTPLPKPWTGDPPGSSTYTYGDLLEARLPLPAGTANEVIVDVSRICAEPSFPGRGIIIDDLRVE